LADTSSQSGQLELLGRGTLSALAGFGSFWLFTLHTILRSPSVFLARRDFQRLVPQFFIIGASSVPVILVTGTFVGMVLAVQSISQFKAAGLANHMGAIVSLSVVRELGPVLAGVMIAGRIGGALTAELGTMNVTEQIDALRSMGSDPVRVLVAPRFIACLILTPVLTLYCDLMGVFGGWLISVPVYGVPNWPFWNHTERALQWWDIFNGLFKSAFFGAAIGLIACYKGFNCEKGAEGVGRACTQSFVIGFVAILILDFFIAFALAGVYDRIWGTRLVF
jgi:phospholipid/cholesterol/gamma-HCH transport system permease protein